MSAYGFWMLNAAAIVGERVAPSVLGHATGDSGYGRCGCFFYPEKKNGSDNRGGFYQLIAALGKVLPCMAHPCNKFLVGTSALRPGLPYTIIGQLTNRGVIGKSRSFDQKTRRGEKRDLIYLP